MKFNDSNIEANELSPKDDAVLNFSFLDMQKLSFKKISEVALKASESENINHQEAALIIKRLIDILKITMLKERIDFSVFGNQDSTELPY